MFLNPAYLTPVLGNPSPPLLTNRLTADLVQIASVCQDGDLSFVCKLHVNAKNYADNRAVCLTEGNYEEWFWS